MEEHQIGLLADELGSAADAVRDAFERYSEIAGKSAAVPPTEIDYTPSPALIDVKRYVLERAGTLHPFHSDEILKVAASERVPLVQMLLLSQSPHWEDRVRAQALYLHQSSAVRMPDNFPCIYEPADSPRNARVLRPRPQVWVASPDEAMLQELLPLYQELWASYESQWPESPSRVFVVGRLNGVSPHGIYRPGATAADVIASTMLTHDGLYGRAPEHLRKMHPRHADWTAPPRQHGPKRTKENE